MQDFIGDASGGGLFDEHVLPGTDDQYGYLVDLAEQDMIRSSEDCSPPCFDGGQLQPQDDMSCQQMDQCTLNQAHFDAIRAPDDAMIAQMVTQSRLQLQFMEDMRLQSQRISDTLDEQVAETSLSVDPRSGNGELLVDLPDYSVKQPVMQEFEQQVPEHTIWDFTQHDGESFHQAWERFCSLVLDCSEDDVPIDTRPWSFYVRLPRLTQDFL